MAKKTQVVSTYDPEKKNSFGPAWVKAERFFRSAGVRIHLDASVPTKAKDKIDELGKPADYVAEFDDGVLRVLLVFASKKKLVGRLDVYGECDVDERRKVMQGLFEKTKLVDASTWKKFDRANPDPDLVKELEFTAYDAQNQMDADLSAIKTLKRFRYDEHRYSGQGSLMMQIEDEAKKKGYGQYFSFVEAVDRGKDGRKVYEVFLSPGAKKRVRMPSGLSGVMEKEYEGGGAVDLKAARKVAIAVIDREVVPKIASRLVGVYRKDYVTWKKRREAAAKRLKEMGVGVR